MSRLVKQIEIEGKAAIALFDSGVHHSFVRRELLAGVPMCVLREPYRVRLAGRLIEVKEECIAIGTIEGLSFDAGVIPVDELGEADGHALDAIIGTFAMGKWEIKLHPENGTLDLGGLRRRTFTEYTIPQVEGRNRRPEGTPVFSRRLQPPDRGAHTAQSRRDGRAPAASRSAPRFCRPFGTSLVLGPESGG
ncbi:MAG: hypothetical protein FJ291_03085 [Planctomycetes bacterium]|nr:hypothetical protein [Planctomycetota bacterium]